MHKNDNKYVFSLSYSTKTKIFIRRLSVSKRIVQGSGAAVSLVLLIGLVSFGFTNFIQNSNDLVINQPQPTTLTAKRTNRPTQTDSYNYDRPVSSDSINTGGPTSEFQLTVESEADETEMERQLQIIETTSNPAFLPTIWAHMGKINNEFGFRRNPFGGRSYEFHAGMDIDGDRGDIVVAPGNGTVVKAGWQGGYGNMIEIDHGNGLSTRYGHLSKLEIRVGDTVQRGQLIGLVGSTGRSTGPHLHYELRLFDKSINPRRFLPPEPAEING